MKHIRKINTRRRITPKNWNLSARHGYTREHVIPHRTYISDPDVRRAITRLSIINVIS